jgi:predicted NBD/HSP70 family sugar kinase
MFALGIDVGGGSVKAAALRDGRLISTSRSPAYHRPTLAQLGDAVRAAVNGLGGVANFDAVGLCVPGLLDDARQRVVQSVNVPGLSGVVLADFLAQNLDVSPQAFSQLDPMTDAQATADDIYHSFSLKGRLFALVVGTGVGAAVMDESGPLCVDGGSPGHFGQLDVSLEGPAGPLVLGPDGGAGSLEGYIGAHALERAYGPGLTDPPSRILADDPPIRALARAIRIAHAIYRPHHVYLAGGLGIRLGHLLAPLRRRIETHLTHVARPDWTFATGTHDHHAAVGAARAAQRRLESL